MKKLKNIITLFLTIIMMIFLSFNLAGNANALTDEMGNVYDIYSVSDFGMGNIGESKSYTKINQDYRLNFSDENEYESMVFRFYFKPSESGDLVTVRFGFNDSWEYKIRFDLCIETNTIQLVYNESTLDFSSINRVFNDKNKEYLVELGMIRNADGTGLTNVFAKVDDYLCSSKFLEDVGGFDETNNRIHFYSASNKEWSIRDYRNLDDNYDEITLHDIYLTATRLQKEELKLNAGTVQFGNYSSNTIANDLVFRFYYNPGSIIEEGYPFYIRLKTTSDDHAWLGLNVIMNLNDNGTGIVFQKEVEGDTKYVSGVFNENRNYFIEIGAVGIGDDSNNGYFYVRVDNETVLASTFDKNVYSSNYISFYQSENLRDLRMVYAAETVNVYNEFDNIVESYYVPYKGELKVPEYEPQAKVQDKYYESYEYLYWSIDSKEEFDFENQVAKKNVNLKPYYRGKNAKEYEITFIGNNDIKTIKYSMDNPLVEPIVPTKEYYIGKWEDYELSYDENQSVNAKYQAILYKVLVRFTFDKRDSETFYFSADKTEEELNDILNSILALKPRDNKNYTYKWDDAPTSLVLGENAIYTLSKVDPNEKKEGCKKSISEIMLFESMLLSLGVAALIIKKNKKEQE